MKLIRCDICGKEIYSSYWLGRYTTLEACVTPDGLKYEFHLCPECWADVRNIIEDPSKKEKEK